MTKTIVFGAIAAAFLAVALVSTGAGFYFLDLLYTNPRFPKCSAFRFSCSFEHTLMLYGAIVVAVTCSMAGFVWLRAAQEAWDQRRRTYRHFVRQYDVSGYQVLAVGLLAVLVSGLAAYAPSLVSEFNEVAAAYIAAVVAVGLFLRVLYTWVYGSKVEVPRFSYLRI